MSLPATSTEAAESITLGAQPVGTIGYNFPRLLCPAQPNGVLIEVWSKLHRPLHRLPGHHALPERRYSA